MLTTTLSPLWNRAGWGRRACAGAGDWSLRGDGDGRSWWVSASAVGRSVGTEFDVRECDGGAAVVGDHVVGVSGGGRASATGHTRLRRVLVEREVGVEPEHVRGVVTPERHDEHHAVGQGIAHLLSSTLEVVVLVVTEQGLLGDAEFVGDGVVLAQRREGSERVLVRDAVLNVDTADLDESAIISVVSSDESGMKVGS